MLKIDFSNLIFIIFLVLTLKDVTIYIINNGIEWNILRK